MKHIPVACGLYSVRDELGKDLQGTLRAVAEMGYEGVEFFGSIDRDVSQIKAALVDADLKVCGWHTGWGDLSDEKYESTVAFHKALGNNTLIVPGLPAEMTDSADSWRSTAAEFNAMALKLQRVGMRLGYHNHSAEFKPFDSGEVAWDIFASETDEAIILQLDNGNAMAGDADTLSVLKKYPKRARTIHLKPYSKETGFMTMVGDDDIPWKETFDEILCQGVTEWYIVEYEEEKMYSQLDGVRICLERLKALGI